MANRSREFHVERSLAEPPSNGPSREGPNPFNRVVVRESSLTPNAGTSARMRDLQPARSTKRAVGSFIRLAVRMPTRVFSGNRPARMRELQPKRPMKRAEPFIPCPWRCACRAYVPPRTTGTDARPSIEATGETRWTTHPRGGTHADAHVPLRTSRHACATFNRSDLKSAGRSSAWRCASVARVPRGTPARMNGLGLTRSTKRTGVLPHDSGAHALASSIEERLPGWTNLE